MNKRVVLVYPNIVTGWQARPRTALPLSLLCLATPVINSGYEVIIIDQRVEPAWESILRQELRKSPVCVGISSMTGPQLRHALDISKIVKEYGNSPVVWGGTHASLLPEQTLESEHIDIVVQGEGEETFPELVEALDGKGPLSAVKGLWYKENGQVKNTGRRSFIDLNRQPPVPYHLVDVKKYHRSMFEIEHLDFFSSRGCPHHCTFCYNSEFHNNKWRSMDPDLVIRNIRALVQRYGTKGLHFNDSNFFFDIDRGRRILEGILKEGLNISIARINIDFLTFLKMDGEDITLLYNAGCRRLPIAVESGSPRIQKLLKKPIDVERLLETNLRLRKYDLDLHYAFMMGIPTETEEDLAESISLALRLLNENPRAEISFNIFTPFPGTELFDIALRNGLRFPERIQDWFSFNYRNLAQGAPWLSKHMRRLVQVLDFCILTMLLAKRPFLRPYDKIDPAISIFSRIYAPIARMRVKHLWGRFPIEMRMAKSLGLYAKQD
jgi:anaerobic magnesium-protoporphyrin IX monomethyl ester cyclase